jgi:glycosyltransferase involved in cell wall biosynthesis
MATSFLKARQWYKRQDKFDLIIDQHHGIPWFAPWWGRTNCVAFIHEVLGPIWGAFYPWPISTFGRAQEMLTHRLYRNIPFWTVSDSTKKALVQNGVKDVTVLPNGTDATPLPFLEPKPLVDPITLIVVCRLAPNKRVDAAMDAFCEVRSRHKAVRLVVVGSGEEEINLKRKAAQSPYASDIIFTGPLGEEEKNAQLRQAHLLLHTSLREGWGLNVIEANALGTPAVVYPVGGLVDSTVHGETGFISRSETPTALAESVLEMIANQERYEGFRKRAWERSKLFEWPNVLPRTCAWLEKQAAKSGSGKKSER